MESITLKKFDLERIKNSKLVVIIGKSRSGKTTLVNQLSDMICQTTKISDGLIMSTNNTKHEYMDTLYQNKVKTKISLHDNPTQVPKTTNRYITKRKSQVDKDIDNKLTVHDCSYGLIVYDDVLKKDIFNSKSVKQIAFNGRHIRINCICTFQDCVLPPMFRCNVDFWFIFNETGSHERKRLYEHVIGGIFPTLESLCTTLDKYTKNYGCLVIDGTSKSTKLEDIIFYYNANPNAPNPNTGEFTKRGAVTKRAVEN